MKKKNDENKEPSEPKDNWFQKNNNESITEGLSLQEIITLCGEIHIDFSHLCWLCKDMVEPHILMKLLNDPTSEAYSLYNKGIASGLFKMNLYLTNNISEPKSKDAYKSLSAERRRQAISAKLNELFGTDEE